MPAGKRLWRSADGELVPEGHDEAVTLAYGEDDVIDDDLEAKVKKGLESREGEVELDLSDPNTALLREVLEHILEQHLEDTAAPLGDLLKEVIDVFELDVTDDDSDASEPDLEAAKAAEAAEAAEKAAADAKQAKVPANKQAPAPRNKASDK